LTLISKYFDFNIVNIFAKFFNNTQALTTENFENTTLPEIVT